MAGMGPYAISHPASMPKVEHREYISPGVLHCDHVDQVRLMRYAMLTRTTQHEKLRLRKFVVILYCAVDGCSYFLKLLDALPSKDASLVYMHYHASCEQYGYPNFVASDRGTEAIIIAFAQGSPLRQTCQVFARCARSTSPGLCENAPVELWPASDLAGCDLDDEELRIRCHFLLRRAACLGMIHSTS